MSSVARLSLMVLLMGSCTKMPSLPPTTAQLRGATVVQICGRRWGTDTTRFVCKDLELGRTISVGQMRQLEKLPLLKEIHLQRLTFSNGTESWMRHLKGLVHLRHLGLEECKISDIDIAQIKKMRQLQRLILSETGVTDAGLALLKGLTDLRVLALDRTKVTDSGLSHLAALWSLRELNLEQTGIGDAGLMHLKGLKQLRKLNVNYTKATRDGAEKLKKSLPRLSIYGFY